MKNSRIDPTRVAFDFDGVFADTMGLYLDIARDEFQVEGLRYADIVCYDIEECLDIAPDISERIIDRILDGSYRVALKPIDGAADVLARLIRYRGSALFVTARPHVGPVAGWISEILPFDDTQIEVIPTGTHTAKTDILLDRGISFFVEDRLETCHLLEAAGITPVLFRQPWNRTPHDYLEVSNWGELEALIDFDMK